MAQSIYAAMDSFQQFIPSRHKASFCTNLCQEHDEQVLFITYVVCILHGPRVLSSERVFTFPPPNLQQLCNVITGHCTNWSSLRKQNMLYQMTWKDAAGIFRLPITKSLFCAPWLLSGIVWGYSHGWNGSDLTELMVFRLNRCEIVWGDLFGKCPSVNIKRSAGGKITYLHFN